MNRYNFLEKIGNGTHGCVYLLKDTDNTLVACKSIPVKYKKNGMREVSILNKLSHRRIINLYEMVMEEERMCLIMEYIGNGSLDMLINYHMSINKISNFNIWSIFAQMIEGLSYLHKKNIIHRDIKPSNILVGIKKGPKEYFYDIKICDFGLSIFLKNKYINDGCFVGTSYYMAPEIWLKDKYDCKVDMWSLGVVLYEIVTFKKPFTGRNRTELREDIFKKEINEISECEDKFLEKLILKSLCINSRISSIELRKEEKIKYFINYHKLKQKDLKIKELKNIKFQG
ncbi:Serine/Threonine protein kinase, partial [Spraguea lophii 42_110]